MKLSEFLPLIVIVILLVHEAWTQKLLNFSTLHNDSFAIVALCLSHSSSVCLFRFSLSNRITSWNGMYVCVCTCACPILYAMQSNYFLGAYVFVSIIFICISSVRSYKIAFRMHNTVIFLHVIYLYMFLCLAILKAELLQWEVNEKKKNYNVIICNRCVYTIHGCIQGAMPMNKQTTLL